jgi:hypothetical protein
VFAAVSHLPHLLSFALVHDLAQRENREEFFRFRRQRLPRLHPDRRQFVRDVARHRASPTSPALLDEIAAVQGAARPVTAMLEELPTAPRSRRIRRRGRRAACSPRRVCRRQCAHDVRRARRARGNDDG